MEKKPVKQGSVAASDALTRLRLKEFYIDH